MKKVIVAQEVQLGLYKKGPFTPLPPSKIQKYGELAISLTT